jgi:hypothetical protein
MKRSALLTVVLGSLATSGGCDAIRQLLGLDTVEVVLNNQADYPVDVDLYISNEKDIPEAVLVTVGEHLEFNLSPGQTQRFSRSCDDLKAIIISDADLQVFGGPDTETNVLRADGDFNCGDEITFTFDHSSVLTDFHVNTDVRRRSPTLP